MWHAGEERCMRPSFWWGNPKERDLVRGVSVVERIILKWILSYNERCGGDLSY